MPVTAENLKIKTGGAGGNGLIWLAAIGGTLYLLYDKVLKPNVVVPKQLQQYSMKLRVYMPTMRLKGDNAEFDMYIQNPNSTPLTVSAIVGECYLVSRDKTYKLGNVARYGRTVIKPTAETKFSFTVRLRFLGLLPYFTDILAGKIRGQVLTFRGNININGRVWPITESLKIA